MTTTQTEAPIAPTADIVNLASRFNVSAITRNHPLSELFSRWLDLRIASAQHSPDLLADIRFGDVLDLVLTARAATASQPFDILSLTRRTKA